MYALFGVPKLMIALSNAIFNGQSDGTRMTPMIEINARNDGLKLEAALAGPVDGGLSDSVCSDKDVVSAIPALSCGISPFNIAWLVVTIVVDSVQRMIRRGFSSDFGQKLLKALESELNTSTAIGGVFLIIGIAAPSFCSVVGSEFFCSPSAMSFAASKALAKLLTSARAAVTSAQALAIEFFYDAAFTLAAPHNGAVLIQSRRAKSGPEAKLLASQVNCFAW